MHPPTHPLNNPWQNREITRGTYVVDEPKNNIENDNPSGPRSRTGLRPNRSDKEPHITTVELSAKKNTDSCEKDSFDWMCIKNWMLTHDNTSVMTSLSFIPLSNASFSYKLIDERIDDQSCNRLWKQSQKEDEYLKFGQWRPFTIWYC